MLSVKTEYNLLSDDFSLKRILIFIKRFRRKFQNDYEEKKY